MRKLKDAILLIIAVFLSILIGKALLASKPALIELISAEITAFNLGRIVGYFIPWLLSFILTFLSFKFGVSYLFKKQPQSNNELD
ncbi:hypothetical protein [Arenibacter certesii]|uniref:Uncharacterized protein n=1 Tax=Arenibacter certesii TaxID=228955 RepID=A0A918J434_9FLAO|nr:hypothetical protein [Arenibacter certesii]GGW46857.1 hypothetical protein GCM10007383_33910 [Arenibacter certesii]